MIVIRKHGIAESIFPVYFRQYTADEAIISRYTYFDELPTGDVVAYSFVSDAIVMLDNKEYTSLITLNISSDDILFVSLNREGFFISKDVDELGLIVDYRKGLFEKKTEVMKVVIVPTTRCNANCSYCINNYLIQCNMDHDTADGAIDYIVDRARDYCEIRLDWYGGEPLLKSDIITYICSRIREHLPDTLLSSVITTNLVLLDDALIETAINTWNVRKVNVTFDGGRVEHNLRKGYSNSSFNGYAHNIWCIRRLLEQEINVFCRFNVDKRNLAELHNVIEAISPFINNPHFYFFVSPLRGCPHNADFYSVSELNDLSYQVWTELNENGIHNSIDSFIPRLAAGVCLAKNKNCFVIGPDGRLFRCNLDNNMESLSTGSVSSGLIHNEVYMNYTSDELDTKCTKCIFLPICQGGCPNQANNLSESNSQCNKFRYKIEASSRILAEYYLPSRSSTARSE